MVGAYIGGGCDNWQIFRHDNPIRLFGTSSGGTVFVKAICEYSGENILNWKQADMTDGGKWSIALTLPRGLYTICTCLRENNEDLELARQGDKRFHVGVGELFIIAGQSNAVGFGREQYNDPPQLGIHIRRNSGLWDLAVHPLGDSTGSMKPNRDMKNPGHSPYLAFAKKLRERLNCPIGFIQTAMGGSGMRLWNPSEDGILYKNMLDAVRGCGSISGVLWYQGCSEVMERRIDDYEDRFMNMVNAWRKDLNQPGLPFITCTVNHYDKDMKNIALWEKMRAVQTKIADEHDNIYIVSTAGLETTDGIHNSVASNKIIGEKLARLVSDKIYGNRE